MNAANGTSRRSIVLVGLMGAGKSNIGRRLARRLGLPFTDADEAIEAAAGLRVAEIFARFGEAEFRDFERRTIARLLEDVPMVLSTGGGAFLDPDSRARIAARAVSVWLRAELPVLVRRTAGRTGRPLLAGRDPEATLAGLMAARYPIYAEADIIVDSRDEPAETTTDHVLSALAAFDPALVEACA